MIGTCECCDRQNVPVSHIDTVFGIEAFACYLCLGETDLDPYGELQEKRGSDAHLIWWLNQSDVERIEYLGLAGLLETWPKYLTAQFASRNGRPGRGRLWVDGEIEADQPAPPEEAAFGALNPVCRMAADCGGIVIREGDFPEVGNLPGFVTTFDMKLWLAGA